METLHLEHARHFSAFPLHLPRPARGWKRECLYGLQNGHDALHLPRPARGWKRKGGGHGNADAPTFRRARGWEQKRTP